MSSPTTPIDKTWISVQDRPLIITNHMGRWECTEDGEKEFIAAVPYHDTKVPEKTSWWIRLCVMVDEIGLCVMGDEDNEPTGWTIADITHYFHLPKHP